MFGIARPRAEGAFLVRHPGYLRLLVFAAVLIGWEVYGRSLNPIFLSYPTAIAAAFVRLLANGQLVTASLQSFEALAVGFTIATVVGIAAGVAMGRYRLAAVTLDPFIIALYNTPTVALIPLLQLWFGLGFTAKVVIVFLAAFFPIVMNCYAGIRNTSKASVDVVRAYGGSDRQVVRVVVLPSALPFIMSGLRLAIGRGLIGVIVAEFFTALTGLGGMVVIFSNNFNTASMFVPVIVLVAAGLLLTGAAGQLERRLAAWKESERA